MAGGPLLMGLWARGCWMAPRGTMGCGAAAAEGTGVGEMDEVARVGCLALGTRFSVSTTVALRGAALPFDWPFSIRLFRLFSMLCCCWSWELSEQAIAGLIAGLWSLLTSAGEGTVVLIDWLIIDETRSFMLELLLPLLALGFFLLSLFCCRFCLAGASWPA